MYVVDERGIDDYERANRCLGRADMVFCLGLSVSGICQSSLVFRKNQKIYLSNGLKDIPQIEKQKPGPDYIPLGDTGKRLNAIDFTNRWKLICL